MRWRAGARWLAAELPLPPERAPKIAAAPIYAQFLAARLQHPSPSQVEEPVVEKKAKKSKLAKGGDDGAADGAPPKAKKAKKGDVAPVADGGASGKKSGKKNKKAKKQVSTGAVHPSTVACSAPAAPAPYTQRAQHA